MAKFDQGKPPIHLIPTKAIKDAAYVFGFGAQKYGENNWREDLDVMPYSRQYSSIQRHLMAWFSGEDNDPESGLPHLDHALTQIMILKTSVDFGNTERIDDRYVDARTR